MNAFNVRAAVFKSISIRSRRREFTRAKQGPYVRYKMKDATVGN
jgi:hypothetical protein